MTASASQIKELRARTGAGMMDCKRALAESGGDIDAAIETLRKKGIAAAAQKAGRIAAEGAVACCADENGAALVEINCETDFVAKDESFRAFADAAAAAVLAHAPADLAAAAKLPLASGGALEEARSELVARIGENISLRRFVVLRAEGAALHTYLHGARIGVLVRMRGGDERLGRDVAMHIAASRPLCISADDMPPDTLSKEEAIYAAQAADSGKPAEIAKKMVAGRLQKFLKENTLLGQPFVKDPEQSVSHLLSAASAKVEAMTRFEVGEGLEKREENFAAEVAAAAKGG
ncbi:MAG: translation elongation factor Ts [Gammaproteobacteria bacterium]|nr:translation elongation factor Ts [Gammaproteobacteria bacterium]MDA8011070.1 translation elongation factor Ts [Gammaproteobacteria bacterium]